VTRSCLKNVSTLVLASLLNFGQRLERWHREIRRRCGPTLGAVKCTYCLRLAPQEPQTQDERLASCRLAETALLIRSIGGTANVRIAGSYPSESPCFSGYHCCLKTRVWNWRAASGAHPVSSHPRFLRWHQRKPSGWLLFPSYSSYLGPCCRFDGQPWV
jgi:hypothetical protein